MAQFFNSEWLTILLTFTLGIANFVIEMQNNLMRIDADSQDRVLSALVAANVQIHSLNPVSQTLEEVYLHTTRPDSEQSIAR